eukprot:m.130521 g.130521  ORF g.130521 m.130521 type:complete len:157 (+) comp13717_c0_seq1:241-711(+)
MAPTVPYVTTWIAQGADGRWCLQQGQMSLSSSSAWNGSGEGNAAVGSTDEGVDGASAIETGPVAVTAPKPQKEEITVSLSREGPDESFGFSVGSKNDVCTLRRGVPAATLLKIGDIITNVNGIALDSLRRSEESVTALISKAGDTIELTVKRKPKK